MARRLWEEAADGGEALHQGIVRQRDKEWESERESNGKENEKKKWMFFFFSNSFLNFFNYQKKSQNDVVLTHLTAVDNWGLIEYRIDNN